MRKVINYVNTFFNEIKNNYKKRLPTWDEKIQ